jgi:Transposase, Mutator family
VQAAYQAPSRAIARELAAGIVADYSREQERGVACFMDDFEACITHLRFPVTHRRAIRTPNLLERLFVEERRRLKIIPNAFGERAVLETNVRCADPRCRTMALGQTAISNAGSLRRSGKSLIRNTRPWPASTQSPQRMETSPENPAALGLDRRSPPSVGGGEPAAVRFLSVRFVRAREKIVASFCQNRKNTTLSCSMTLFQARYRGWPPCACGCVILFLPIIAASPCPFSS